jgi:hypothetical protein
MRCKLGIWDDSIPGIKYYGDGVSNYAKIQLKLMEDYPSYYYYFEKTHKYLWPIVSRIVPTKPKIFYEIEERKL